jgi:hypothetical protein
MKFDTFFHSLLRKRVIRGDPCIRVFVFHFQFFSWISKKIVMPAIYTFPLHYVTLRFACPFRENSVCKCKCQQWILWDFNCKKKKKKMQSLLNRPNQWCKKVIVNIKDKSWCTLNPCRIAISPTDDPIRRKRVMPYKI